ncbi:MAG: 2-oxoglutarate dehydrogenase complex dihydrolipoyllysine-residue succinyltransferase [Gammaproteobacteria bacterium]|nr:2-oxoglutarate dehydrogenase complex dihydrolipoyllysine-residue succinyltransferase [Gammaproteobacteria bacterium]
MSIEIKAPQFPESVADGTIATWHRKVGEACQRDDLLVDIETDKVVLEVVAPADGVLTRIVKGEGDTVLSEELLAEFEAGGEASAGADAAESESGQADSDSDSDEQDQIFAADAPMSPAARKLAKEQGIDPTVVEGTGKDGRITKEDVQRAALRPAKPAAEPAAGAAPKDAGKPASPAAPAGPDLDRLPGVGVDHEERPSRRVPMTRLRASIARRLVEAQQTAAMLTTFNEVDMTAVMALRSRHKDAFEKAHNGTRLGFMSFFVRAACEALKRFPAVNASIDGSDIVYHGFYDVGVAVSTERGLVVPVIRDADGLGLAQIEDSIRDFGLRARDGKLGLADMTGGTFTISNGGVFGSLLSTPILNPPQTAILGMHKIQDRPMVVDGEIKAVPMMYLALSYDHRLIDGSEAVRFLVAIKDLIEDPARMLLDI